MKCGVITVIALIALILSVSMWPPGSGASMDLAHDPAPGMIRNASTNARGLLQLAKHQEAEPEAYEDHQFCGSYFKSSSVPYFRDYYSRNDYANLPPGLRKHVLKRGHLPPGLEKKYERTGQLPPGLQKRFECGQAPPPGYSPYLYPVPAVAYQKVGPLPPDSKLYLYGNDLILLNDNTKAIIDMLRGAY
jgi:hypothetical protein